MPRYSTTKVNDLLTKTYADMVNRLDASDLDTPKTGVSDQAQVYSWPRMWGSTACGHPGPGGQTSVTAQTIVYHFPTLPFPTYVYHGGRFSYKIDNPNEQFFMDLQDHQLISEREYDGEYERGSTDGDS